MTTARWTALAAALALGGCGDGGLQGTYHHSEGALVVELKGGDQATVRGMGQDLTCTYQAMPERVTLDCPGMPEPLKPLLGSLSRNADGTLSSGMGVLAKRART